MTSRAQQSPKPDLDAAPARSPKTTAADGPSAPGLGSTPTARAILAGRTRDDARADYEQYKAAALDSANQKTASASPATPTLPGQGAGALGPAPKGKKKPPAGSQKTAPGTATEAPEHGEVTRLPRDIQAQFPDADLSAVEVVLDSQRARRRGLQGFARGATIHVAPGVDRTTVLRHEATHIAQMLKGRLRGRGRATEARDPVAVLEAQADQAQDGRHLPLDDLAVADPTATLNKFAEGKEEAPVGEIPKVSFSLSEKGITLDKISGEWSGTVLDAEWEEKVIAEGNAFYPFPALPFAGVDVKSGVTFKPEAKVDGKLGYAWNAANETFQLTVGLEGGISGALTGYIQGGVELTAVLQDAGIGLRGSIAASAAGKVATGYSVTVDKNGNVTEVKGNTGVAIEGGVKASFSLLAYTEGWFGDKVAAWTFAEFDIASLTGVKADLVTSSTGKGTKTTVESVTPGTLKWGGPPEATPGSAAPMKLKNDGILAVQAAVQDTLTRQLKDAYDAKEAEPEDLMCVMPEEDVKAYCEDGQSADPASLVCEG